MSLVIRGGQVYDPASGWKGECRDIYVKGGRIVPPLESVDEVVSASGQIVIAGGIDCRGQVATYGLDFLRVKGLMPGPRMLGEMYAALGYTHVHEPFLTGATAGYVHRELSSLPLVDTSASLVFNLRDMDMGLKNPERRTEVIETLRFLLEKSGALTLRVVESFIGYRQDYLTHRRINPEAALAILADLARDLQMVIILETSPDILRLDLPTGVFHLGGMGPALESEEMLAAALAHLDRGVTGDMGLVQPAAGDREHVSVQVDLGWFRPLNLAPGAPPSVRRRALKLALEHRGPGLAYSVAGNAAGAVREFPRFFSWMGDKVQREGEWGEDLPDREWTLAEWVWATRTLPARLLGLTDQGHLGVGARADVALFEVSAAGGPGGRGREHCRTLIKAGEKIIDNFQLIKPRAAKTTFYRQTGAQPTPLVAEICQYRSFRQESLWPQPEGDHGWTRV